MQRHRQHALLAAAALFALSSSACTACDPCAVDEHAAPDFNADENWLCRPDLDDSVCYGDLRAAEVRPDGSSAVVDHVPATDPPIDCFYVYPTMDMRLGAGLHTDLADRDGPIGAVMAQGARFSEVCAVYAPSYRQVTLGTYVASEETRSQCFDVAFGDVLEAFRLYLARFNQGRGVVVIGHSQGAQHTSRLLRSEFDSSSGLQSQLVVAMPIGWPLGVKAGQTTGGSFDNIPICEAADQYGCAIGYRSYAAGNKYPASADTFREGEQVVCTDPAPAISGTTPHLSRSYIKRDLPFVTVPTGVDASAPYLLYRDLYGARCVADGNENALEISYAPLAGDQRANPIDFGAMILSANNGTHILDVQLGLGDLIDQVRVKSAAWVQR